MKLKLKQFGVSGIVSEPNMFLKARLKLTGLYILMLSIIVFGFSIFLYQSIDRNLMDSSEEDFIGTENYHHFVQNTINSVQNEIIFADLFILVISAGLSYVLAGQTLKPIQKSVEAQKIFAANASHELRTPLAVMKSDTEILLRNSYPSKALVESTLQSNLEEMDNMSSMIENLLLLARSDNEIVPPLSEIDLTKLVNEVVSKISPIAKKKGVNLIFTNTDSHLIQGNTDIILRAILNVLQNSIDHTPEGGKVTLSIEKLKNFIVMKISDTGSGIDPKDIPHVFTRFFKGKTSQYNNGSGLGLAIVKEVIEQHKGKVEIESKIGKGTTVTFNLPLS